MNKNIVCIVVGLDGKVTDTFYITYRLWISVNISPNSDILFSICIMVVFTNSQ